MDNRQILEKYEKWLASKGKTRNLYLRYAGNFLEYADSQFDRQTIDRYLDHLRRTHSYSDGTVHFIFGILRTLLTRNGIEWPYRRGEAPVIRENKVVAPALHPTTIMRMIEATKARGQPDEKAWLALSTTYGLRRVEMQELAPDDIKLRTRVIHIATAKHGRERNHRIPEEIVPYIRGYDFPPMAEFQSFVLWYRLENLIEAKHVNQVGLHAIRRTLNTLLLRVLPEATVMSFMRWKQRTSSHMPYRYTAITFVGEEGEESVELVGDALTVDKEVFEKHPFLEFWR